MSKKNMSRYGIRRNAAGLKVNATEDSRCHPSGTPILDQLAELDEIMSAKEGANWVYSIVPDPDGPFLLSDGDEFVLGPGARAAILDMRKIEDMITAADRDTTSVAE